MVKENVICEKVVAFTDVQSNKLAVQRIVSSGPLKMITQGWPGQQPSGVWDFRGTRRDHLSLILVPPTPMPSK